MTDINKKLLALVMESKNLNEISEELNLSPKQIYRRLDSLKNSGYIIGRTLLDSGTIEYGIVNKPVLPAHHSATVKLVKDPYHFEAMVISDLHLGDSEENLERLNIIYEYCINRGINIIINTGDLIDGLNPYNQHIDLMEQPEYLIKKYPYDKSILNLICFGNHDVQLLKKCGVDLSILLKNARPDFISLGYGSGFINILNEQIVLKHYVGSQPEIRCNCISGKLVLVGHRHKMAVELYKKNIILNIPTLSDIIFEEKPTLPGAVELHINFKKNGQWCSIHAEHLVITDKIYPVNEIDFHIEKHQNIFISEGHLTKQKTRKLIS